MNNTEKLTEKLTELQSRLADAKRFDEKLATKIRKEMVALVIEREREEGNPFFVNC